MIPKEGGKIPIPEIVPVQQTDFNQQKIAYTLDNLPIPDAFFYGLRI